MSDTADEFTPLEREIGGVLRVALDPENISAYEAAKRRAMNGDGDAYQRLAKIEAAEERAAIVESEPEAARIISEAFAGEPPATAAGPVMTCLADVEPCEIDWLWAGHIPLKRITLLAGRPGGGKSFFTTDASSRVSTGTPWPDGATCPIGSVILISGEDDPGDTIRPRLDAHLADCSKIHLLTASRRVDEDGKVHDVIFTLADVLTLEAALKLHPDCKLVIIDPIGSFLGGTVDGHRDNEVRGVLAPVAALASKYGPAVLIVAHHRKAAGNFADDLTLGSKAFTGIARCVWHLSRDPESKTRRLLLPGKNNLSAEGDGLAFSIQGEPPAIVWEREPVCMSADDALAVQEARQRPGPEPEARDAAIEWLQEVLANGAVPSGDLKQPAAGSVRALAKAAELKWATVRRAADKLGVRREKDSFSKVWVWRLPKPGKVVVAQPEQLEPNTKNLSNLSNINSDTETPIENRTRVSPARDVAQLAQFGVEPGEPCIELPDGRWVAVEGGMA